MRDKSKRLSVPTMPSFFSSRGIAQAISPRNIAESVQERMKKEAAAKAVFADADAKIAAINAKYAAKAKAEAGEDLRTRRSTVEQLFESVADAVADKIHESRQSEIAAKAIFADADAKIATINAKYAAMAMTEAGETSGLASREGRRSMGNPFSRKRYVEMPDDTGDAILATHSCSSLRADETEADDAASRTASAAAPGSELQVLYV